MSKNKRISLSKIDDFIDSIPDDSEFEYDEDFEDELITAQKVVEGFIEEENDEDLVLPAEHSSAPDLVQPELQVFLFPICPLLVIVS